VSIIVNGSVPTERLSRLIGMTYDCVLEPDRWRRLLEEILAELGFSYGVLSISAFPDGDAIFGVAVGIEPEWMGKLQAHWADVMALWGGDARIQQYPLEEPILQSAIVDPRTVGSNPYFSDWFQAQGFIDAVAIGLERNARMVASLALGRHKSRGPVTPEDMETLRLLAPHLRRASGITQQLELQAIAASAYSTVVEDLGTGVILVDELMGVIHANPAAGALLETDGPFQIVNGRLVAGDDAATVLERAVANAEHDEAALGRSGGAGIPTRGASGQTFMIHVLPLRSRESRGGIALPATAALFIAPALGPISLPTESIAMLYGLTPAELRIFQLVAEGKTSTAIAQQLGLNPATVKTHLSRLFQKTGRRRQADLVMLAASLRLPV
jgi:DNA-binding CsgD family transcriptional regulator/PAS domain-containing protein